MPTRRRLLGGAFALLLAALPAAAQGVLLAEPVQPGDCFRYEIDLVVAGKMKVDQNGRLDSLTLDARGRHRFAERVDAPAAAGIGKAVRFYDEATSESAVAADRGKRTLSADRRVVVAQRDKDGTLHYSPDGPLTRDDLELVAEHFDTLAVPALLPGKEAKPGDTWPLSNDAAQALCHFDGLVKHDLIGKLVEVSNGVAAFAVEGKAEGIEDGATARISVSAKGTFDLAAKRVTAVIWEQTDVRDQGPVSPAVEVKATVTLRRAAAGEPKELAAGRAKVPAGAVPDVLLQLRYADPAGKYQFVHPRDWHVVGKADRHLVVRLVDRGEFAAQVTLTEWKKADPGTHDTPDRLKEAAAKQPGWQPERLLAEGELPTDNGRWLYRVAFAGKQDGTDVVQAFHLLAGPAGDQIVATAVCKPDKADKVGARDVALINAIELPKK